METYSLVPVLNLSKLLDFVARPGHIPAEPTNMRRVT